jgi:hypothetical protein
MVVGWQIADHMRTALIVEALEMARLHGQLQPNAIFNSEYPEVFLKPESTDG